MTNTKHVQVLENMLDANDYVANGLRAEWDARHILAVNLLSSPGSGKTTLLEAALPWLCPKDRILVFEGDIETERDAERIRSQGIDAFQITTGGTCHLEAHMIEQAWKLSDRQQPLDFIFIENVGNLVCPASFDLGEHVRVVMVSAPEGDDKPAKYPKAFRTADAFVITKSDMLPYTSFSVERAIREAKQIQPNLKVFVLSAQNGEGVQEWRDYLLEQRRLRFPEA